MRRSALAAGRILSGAIRGNTAPGSGLVETAADIGHQRVLHIPVGACKVEPVGIEMTAAPSFHVAMIWVMPVVHDGQEPLVATNSADIFGGTRAGSRDTGASFWNSVQGERLLNLDCMAPAVAEIVKIAERRDAAAIEIEKAHRVFVKDVRTVPKKPLFLLLGVTVPKTADVEYMQVAIPPVEGGLDREMKLSQMPGPWDDEPSPDHRLDFRQRDPDLERIWFLIEHGMQ